MKRYQIRQTEPERYSMLDNSRVVGVTRYASDITAVQPVSVQSERYARAVAERIRVNASFRRHESFAQMTAELAKLGIRPPAAEVMRYARPNPQPNRTAERIAAKAKQLVAKGRYLSYDEIAKTLK